MPADKQVAPLPVDTLVADRTNMAYLGTTVVSGTGLAVVVATGTHTELGRIGTLVNAIEDEPTPLERRLDALGRRLAWLTIAISGVVAAAAAFNGAPWDAVLQTGIALAVAAMPEALPAVATIALAVGMRRMVRRHALVRRLPAVESLGSATIVCTDKTRTLTTGRMTVVRIWTAGGEFRLHERRARRVAAGRPGRARDRARRPRSLLWTCRGRRTVDWPTPWMSPSSRLSPRATASGQGLPARHSDTSCRFRAPAR